MWKHILTYSALTCSMVVHGFFGKVVSKGKWLVDKTARCPDYEKYPHDVDLHIRVINETHNAIFAELVLKEDLTEDDFGIYIEVCKKTEVGCNIIAVVEDESFCRFLVEHAEENFKKVLTNMGAADHCPIKKGSYKLVDFVFDSRELPDDGMCGSFIGKVYVKKDEKDMACFAIHVHFDEYEKDDKLPLV